MNLGWNYIDIKKLVDEGVDEATLSGQVGATYPKPFFAIDDDERKKKQYPLLRAPNVGQDEGDGLADSEKPDREDAKVWKPYVG